MIRAAVAVRAADRTDVRETIEPKVSGMGDKSPKSINRAKKQDAAEKNQRKAAAAAKAPSAVENRKKTK